MRASLVLLAAMVSVAYAVGQYYVPRSYYTIDSDGHETAPVPLRRLRRSAEIFRPKYDASPNANANADNGARGGGIGNANADAKPNANGFGRRVGASRGTGVGTSRGTSAGYLGTRAPIPGRGSSDTRSESGLLQDALSLNANNTVAVDSVGNACLTINFCR